jgi:myo-inositol-hexaphosphate 3-phosphohydrolase
MVEYKKIDYADDGRMNYIQLNKNFENMGKDITAIMERDVQAIKDTVGLVNFSVLCEEKGFVTILPARMHSHLALRSGYIVAGDNVKETVSAKVIYGNNEKELATGIIKSTEKAGKAHNLVIKEGEIIHQIEEVVVYTDNRRKLLVNLTFEVKE